MRLALCDTYIDHARRLQKRHILSTHIALIVRAGRVLAMSANRPGTRSSGSGFSNMSIHAEKAVVKQLGDISALRGATLIVFRLTRDNQQIGCSKPCPDCHAFLDKCMKKYGLLRVYYSA
jgi:hypothetical protein